MTTRTPPTTTRFCSRSMRKPSSTAAPTATTRATSIMAAIRIARASRWRSASSSRRCAPFSRGEELAYDYQIQRDADDSPDVDEIFACRCGAASCRGSMLEAPKRPRKRKPREARRKPHERGVTARAKTALERAQDRAQKWRLTAGCIASRSRVCKVAQGSASRTQLQRNRRPRSIPDAVSGERVDPLRPRAARARRFRTPRASALRAGAATTRRFAAIRFAGWPNRSCPRSASCSVRSSRLRLHFEP